MPHVAWSVFVFLALGMWVCCAEMAELIEMPLEGILVFVQGTLL